MKQLLLALIILGSTAPTFAGIVQVDPTKVIIDTDTGAVIFMPRDLDYDFALASKTLDINYALETKKADKIHIPSLKEILLGKSSCGG